jgi:hypothetical protein
LREVLRHDRFSEAVKLHRELTGSDLLAAKSSVERIQTSLGITKARLARWQELAEPALITAVTLAIISIAWSLPSSAAYTLTLGRTSSLEPWLSSETGRPADTPRSRQMMSMKKTWCCRPSDQLLNAAVAQSAGGGAQRRQNLPLTPFCPSSSFDLQ